MPKNRKRPILIWAALAACLLMIACAIVIPHLHKASSAPADLSAAEVLTQLGLNAEIVENPTITAAAEQPYVSREDARMILNNAELIADCTVEEIDRIKVREPDSDNVWFITAMTLSRTSTIRGSTEEDRLRVVSAAATNEPVEFLSEPGLEECRNQMHAAFLLRSVGEDDIWTVGGTEIPVRELGDFFVISCMGFDRNSIQYQDYKISLEEIN